MKKLMEDVNDFGMPEVEQPETKKARHPHYKEMLERLMAAAEMHLAIMAGSAPEDEVDPLQATMDEIMVELSPEGAEEGPEEKEDAEKEDEEEGEEKKED